MPTLTITHSPSGVSFTETFSGTEQTKFLNWWRATRPMNPDNRTDADVLNEWARAVMNETWKTVYNREKTVASKAAIDATPAPVRT
jgi:hypothetical protein